MIEYLGLELQRYPVSADLGDCKSHGMTGKLRYAVRINGLKPSHADCRKAFYACRLFILLSRRKPKRSRIRKKLAKAALHVITWRY